MPARRVAIGLVLLGGWAVARPAAERAAVPAATGSIEGTVRLNAQPIRPVPSGVYPSRLVTAPAPAAASELSNVVVFIKDAPARERLTVTRATITQKDESFVPRVLAITTGSTVEFPNFDPYFHNVFSLSRAASFDLGRYRRGDTRSRKFAAAGLIKVYCHIHSHMNASIMVLDHDYFRIPDANGSFTLHDVAVGTHRISAWHERIGESVREVRVDAGARTRVEFALPVHER